MSFVQEVTTNPSSQALVVAVIAMGHSLGLEVLAEGVELTEQADLLRELGCDSMQGYLVSRPVSAADAASVFSQYESDPPVAPTG